jgi:hypothetical protein
LGVPLGFPSRGEQTGGRITQRKDYSAQRYLGWVQLAACTIFIRSGFVP